MSTLTGPTRQEVFDRVLAFMRKQKAPSRFTDRGYTTFYYLPESKVRCSIGCLIPKDVYHENIEGYSIEGILLVYSPLRRYRLTRPFGPIMAVSKFFHDTYDLDVTSGPFLAMIQTAHERAILIAGRNKVTFIEEFNKEMEIIAKHYALDYQPMGT